jgi:uncharacterized peroxidase-related enzyme
MSRMPTPTIDGVPAAAGPLLEKVFERFGTIPNFFGLLATSPAVLDAYLRHSAALDGGSLPSVTRTRIALSVAEANGCDYCLSAQVHLARMVSKMDDTEITANRNGASNDIKADAAVRFAAKLVHERGRVSADDVSALGNAGFSGAEVIEIIANVALNVFTNYVNQALKPEIDFPHVVPRPRGTATFAATPTARAFPEGAQSTSF